MSVWVSADVRKIERPNLLVSIDFRSTLALDWSSGPIWFGVANEWVSADGSHFVPRPLCPFLVKPRALTRRKRADKGIPDFSLWLWCRCLITQRNPIDVRAHRFWCPFQTDPHKRDDAYRHFKTATAKATGAPATRYYYTPEHLLLYYRECLFSCWKRQSSYNPVPTLIPIQMCVHHVTRFPYSCTSLHTHVCHHFLGVSRCAALCKCVWHIKTKLRRGDRVIHVCTLSTTWPVFDCLV